MFICFNFAHIIVTLTFRVLFCNKTNVDNDRALIMKYTGNVLFHVTVMNCRRIMFEKVPTVVYFDGSYVSHNFEI